MVELPLVFLGVLGALIVIGMTMGIVASKKVEELTDEISDKKHTVSTEELTTLTEKHKRFRYMRNASLPLVIMFALVIIVVVLNETVLAVSTGLESLNSLLDSISNG